MVEVANRAALSKSYISYLETGVKPVSIELRNRLLAIYGYSPSSFKNFTTEDKRAKNIPVRYKLEILLGQLDESGIDRIYAAAVEFIKKPSQQNQSAQGELK